MSTLIFGHGKNGRVPGREKIVLNPFAPPFCSSIVLTPFAPPSDGSLAAVGRLLGRPVKHWVNYRDGTISRAALQRRLAPVRRTVERLPLRGMQSAIGRWWECAGNCTSIAPGSGHRSEEHTSD